MIKLLLSGFLLSISCISNAATVQPTDLTDNPIQFNDTTNSTLPAQLKTNNHHDKYIQDPSRTADSTQQLESGNNIQEAVFFNTATYSQEQSIPFHQHLSKLTEFTKKLRSEYEGNDLVQQSLTTFYDAKQLWDSADSKTNAFATDIAHSLNLDKLIEDDFLSTHYSINSPSVSFINKNIIFSRQRRKQKKITYSQIRQTQAYKSSNNINAQNSHFVTKIFSMTTIYYLVAFFTLFSLVQWAIKFTIRFFP